jgi:hypothetical protein
LKDVFDHFELTLGCLLGIATNNHSFHYSMTGELQSTLEVAGIGWPTLRNNIPCMAHISQLAFGAFLSSFSVKGHPKSWEAHEPNYRFGDIESIDIGKSQRLRKGGNARINKVLAPNPGLVTIVEKVCIS